jgi:hypothetical protein
MRKKMISQMEKHREFWANIAKEHGWYKEPFYIQVWVDAEGSITDSVSFPTLSEDLVVLDDEDDEDA